MSVLLVVLALLAAGLGGVLLSQATFGVGVICGACLLAVLARIAQANEQHRQVLEQLAALRVARASAVAPEATPPPKSPTAAGEGTMSPQAADELERAIRELHKR